MTRPATPVNPKYVGTPADIVFLDGAGHETDSTNLQYDGTKEIITVPSIGTGDTAGLQKQNTTAATNGFQQNSPMDVETGQGWVANNNPFVRSFSSFNTHTGGTDANLVVPSAISGDIIIIAVATYTASGTTAPGTPSGAGSFSSVGTNSVASNWKLQIWQGPWSGDSSITLPKGTTTGSDSFGAFLWVVGNTNGVIDGTPTGTSNGSSVTSLVLNGTTTTTTPDALMCVWLSTGIANLFPPASMQDPGTLAVRVKTLTTGKMEGCFQSFSPAGATGTRTMTADSGVSYCGLLFALSPLSSSGFSSEIDFATRTTPVQGANVPTGKRVWSSRVAASLWKDVMSLDAAGNLVTAGSITAGVPANPFNCIVAALSNVTLSGLSQVFDGGTTVLEGSMVLCVGQTTFSQNGPWVAHSGAWTRPPGYATGATVGPFVFCGTLFGAVSYGTMWMGVATDSIADTGQIVVDTTGTRWQQVGGMPTSIQTGTSYTFTNSTKGCVVQFNNSSPIAGTLPFASNNQYFGVGWWTLVANIGAGTLTITPTFGTIDGASSKAFTTGQSAILYTDGSNYFTALNASASSSVSALTDPVNQASHGFTVGQALKLTGTKTYGLAKADTAANADVAGIVSTVVDSNNFILTTSGYIPSGMSVTAAATHFLSPTVAGALTTTEPNTAGQVTKPIFYADSTTSGYVLNYRGIVVTSTATSFSPAGPGHANGPVPDPGATAHTPAWPLLDDATFHPPSDLAVRDIAINGNWRYWQALGTAPGAIIGATHDTYFADQWKANNVTLSGANWTPAQATASPNFGSTYLTLTQGSATADKIAVWQPLESWISKQLSNLQTPVVLTVYAKCSLGTPKLNIGLVEFAGTADSLGGTAGDIYTGWSTSSTVNPTWASNYSLNGTTGQITLSSSVQKLQVVVTPSTSKNNLLPIIWLDATVAQTAVITLYDFSIVPLSPVRVDDPSLLSPFRFYYSTYDNGTAPGTAFSAGNAQIVFAVVASANTTMINAYPFPVPLRAAPSTITFYDAAGSAGKISFIASSSAWTNGGTGFANGANTRTWFGQVNGVEAYNYAATFDARL